MKLLRVLFWLCLWALPVQALAERVSVQGGEHEGFSRLVFYFPAGRDWSVTQAEEGFAASFAVDSIDLVDLGVFDLIPRARVAQIATGPDGRSIIIHTGCDCPASTFLIAPGQLVIDIADSPVFAAIQGAEFVQADDTDEPPTVSTTADRLPDLLPPSSFFDIEPDASTGVGGLFSQLPETNEPTSAMPVSAPSDAPPLEMPAEHSGAMAEPMPDGVGGAVEMASEPEMSMDMAADVGDPVEVEAAQMSLLPIVTNRTASGAPETPAENVVPDADEMAAQAAEDTAERRLEQTRDLVLKELARATSQGLLEANEATSGNLPVPGSQRPSGNELGQSLDLDKIVDFLDAIPNARAETAVDRGIRSEIQPRPLTVEGSHCIDGDVIDIASWTGDGTIYSQISQYRLALFEEFDRENREAAIGLARSYIYLSFGAEALNVLDMIALSGGDVDILRAMAEIVDLGYSQTPGPLDNQITCDTGSAFWAAMALPEFPRGLEANENAILLTFSGLPLHLRRHLGPILALRFLAIGDRDMSFALRDAIDRASGEHGEGYELLRANIDRDLGRTGQAEKRFDEIAALDGAKAPTALVERIEMAIETGGDLPNGAVESVAALAFEYRGTPEGAELAQAYVLANIVENRFDEALSSLLRIETGDVSEADIFPELWSQLALGMSRATDDVVFLSAYYKHRDTLASRQVSQMARERLAARLVGLGFGEDAVTEMGRFENPSQISGELLLARSLILSDDNARAREVLSPLQGEDAQRLLAQIAEKDQQFGEAVDIYGALDDRENQISSAWRAGNWPEVARIAEGTQRSAAELMTAENTLSLSQPDAQIDPNDTSVSGSIAGNEALLTHSAWVRETLGALLEN